MKTPAKPGLTTNELLARFAEEFEHPQSKKYRARRTRLDRKTAAAIKIIQQIRAALGLPAIPPSSPPVQTTASSALCPSPRAAAGTHQTPSPSSESSPGPSTSPCKGRRRASESPACEATQSVPHHRGILPAWNLFGGLPAEQVLAQARAEIRSMRRKIAAAEAEKAARKARRRGSKKGSTAGRVPSPNSTAKEGRH